MTGQPPPGPLRPAGDLTWRQEAKTSCPACGSAQDAFSHPRNVPGARAPKTGDYAVCIRCAAVNIIAVHPLLGASLREATLDELDVFSRNRDATHVVRAVHQIGAPRRGPER